MVQNKPFLKWAGNKYRIAHAIRAVLPAGKRLIEPFAGSAAVFLNTQYDQYVLNDNNADLIQLFYFLQTEGQAFIDFCRSFFKADQNTKEAFYYLRDLFNTTDDLRLKAALFVYLNRHCFNGLCRYNSSGKFNTPHGRYKNPYFPEKEMQAFQEKTKNAQFTAGNFLTTLDIAKPGDIVYCDPPYVPLSATANFISFSKSEFGAEQQQQLACMAETLAAKNITVVISNHDTEFTRSLYHNAKIHELSVQRHISCKGNNRTKAPEILAVFS